MSSPDPAGNPAWRRVRAVLILLGLLLMLGGVLADRIGGQPGSIGVGQVLLAGAGALLVLAGVLGRRFPAFYRAGALVLLNTILLLGAIEMAAIVVGRWATHDEGERIEDLPYYQGQPWASEYWHEARMSESYRYEPFVLWRHRPFEGEWVHYDHEGHRVTPGPSCESTRVRVVTFGGSTMLGWGSPDAETIPAHLARELDERFPAQVCVQNLAEDGYVSTQNLLALALHLRNGARPDVVVFYDGVNDVLAAYESKKAGTHVTLAKIEARFEEKTHPLLSWYRTTRQYALLRRWALKGAARSEVGTTADPALGRAVADTMLGNYRLIEALAKAYGFEFVYFLQPHLGIGDKPLGPQEVRMLEDMDPAWLELARESYVALDARRAEAEKMVSLTGVFDSLAEQVWIDHAGHVTPEGNRRIARAMLPALVPVVESRLAVQTSPGGRE